MPPRRLHPLDGDTVREQLALRTRDLNTHRDVTRGHYVLYWMQSTHRVHENWALRAAIRAADALDRPLVIHQGLDPTYPYASARHHAFMLDGACDTQQRADQAGLAYHFVLREQRDDDRRVVDRLAARANLVVTDLFPTAGVAERSARFAARTDRRVLAVESSCIVPALSFPKAEWAARTIRPKLSRVLAQALEPVEERPPRREASAALRTSLADTMQRAPLPLASMSRADIDDAIARCDIDHTVARVKGIIGGTRAGSARLDHFVRDVLPHYMTHRNEAADDGTSGLSPYLHVGQLSSAEVVRAAQASGAPSEAIAAFVDQVTTWRELSFNWCVHTPRFDQLDALPNWVQTTMRAHADDVRPVTYDLATLESATTHDALWNAAQRQLVQSGVIHNYARMLWGKSILLWAPTYEDARAWMFMLNDRYALDGRDPNSVGGIMWCLGLWDRSWGNKPVWGGLRPMLTARANKKFDVGRYVRRWGGGA
ncbi:MAG: deoxyribodipyrimidine photo-lyase [Gemmatimonadaceae bacterium]|nr:deoxyribodipyrimidine photo-lyase [Gemmatimonadaceae bacterium]